VSDSGRSSGPTGAGDSDPGYVFDEDTAVDQVGPGEWSATVSSRWDVVGGAPNGGYLQAIALRALGHEAGLPDPVTSTAHFVAKPEHGPAIVRTTIERRGRHTTGTARLEQGETTVMLLTATFGDLADASGPTRIDGGPPHLPPLDACVAAPDDDALPPIVRRFDARFDPEGIGWMLGEPSGDGRIAGYIRFADSRPVDGLALPLLADAMPPPVLNMVPGIAWVPTLELTTHVRGRPAPGWLRAVFRTRLLVDGYLEEDGEIWDADGRLVAISRQFALVQMGR
jgi:hypothetical protein